MATVLILMSINLRNTEHFNSERNLYPLRHITFLNICLLYQ